MGLILCLLKFYIFEGNTQPEVQKILFCTYTNDKQDVFCWLENLYTTKAITLLLLIFEIIDYYAKGKPPIGISRSLGAKQISCTATCARQTFTQVRLVGLATPGGARPYKLNPHTHHYSTHVLASAPLLQSHMLDKHEWLAGCSH